MWWFIVLGNAAVSAPTTPGLEYTMPTTAMHYALPDDAIDFVLPDDAIHYTLKGED